MPEDVLPEIGGIALAVAVAVVIAVVVTAVVALVIRTIGKRKVWARLLIRRVRIPFRVLLLTIAVWIALAATVGGDVAPELVARIFQIATIGASAWLVGASSCSSRIWARSATAPTPSTTAGPAACGPR
ncbi:hypothetical protein [Rathayibacter sp. VKM Ac-2630]|uniref:hypothetical protein n=1 Tax=Rathayibacter sp. VKM Ac-2630 TaxID=1938617 RepID=UPI0026951A68